MGPLTLSNSSCTGTVNDVTVDINFLLDGRHNEFLPPGFYEEFRFLPYFQAKYGNTIDGKVGNHTYNGKGGQLPVLYAKYPILIGIRYWQWILMTALKFEGTNLQMQFVGAKMFGIWLSMSYVRYNDVEYHLNDPFLLETTFKQHGEVVGSNRVISAEVKTLLGGLHMSLECLAPTEQFALLEQEGDSYIYTTVLGRCTAIDVRTGKSYSNNAQALMEIKTLNP